MDAHEALEKLKQWAMFEIECFDDIRQVQEPYDIVKATLGEAAKRIDNTLKCFYTEKELPDKFIAIFSDASGCDIYYYSHDDQYGEKMYTSTSDRDDIIGVDKMYFADAGYLWFIALPYDFEV